MKTLLVILVLFNLTIHLYGQGPGEIDYGMYDKVTRINDQDFRVRRIPGVDFNYLRDRHMAASKPEKIVGFSRIGSLLPAEYTLIYLEGTHWVAEMDTTYLLYYLEEVRKGDKLRIFLPDEIWEYDHDYCYLPEYSILGFSVGHGGDAAVDISTGRAANIPVSVSPHGMYRMTGMHDGQDSVNYDIEKWDPYERVYRHVITLCELAENLSSPIIGTVYHLFDYFWVGNKLYFATGYDVAHRKYLSVTMP